MGTFISYSRTNSDFAVKLSKDLKAAGFDIWLDQIDIPTGARWDDEIEKALEKSSSFLIILSPESIESQNVKDEIGYAIDAGKHIVPVITVQCKIPFRLRRFQYVDFTSKPYEENFAEIQQILRKPPPVSPENAPAQFKSVKEFKQAQIRKSKPAGRRNLTPILFFTAFCILAGAAILIWQMWPGLPTPSTAEPGLPTEIVEEPTEAITPTQEAPTTVPQSTEPPITESTAIDEKYFALGGEGGFLGQAETDETTTPDEIGRFRHFQGGSIYWSPDTGAWEVHGNIRDKWASLGWETGFLGYPLTDETETPDGIGRFNHFQGGSIYWTPDTGAWEVHGNIHDKWADLGWERSVLGYPITDESETPDGIGRFNHFQYGSIYWTPNTGAWEVHGAIRDRWAQLGWERSCLGYPVSDEEPGGVGWTRQSRFEHGIIQWSSSRGTVETCY